MYEVAEHYRTPLVSQRVEIDCLLDLPPVLGESVRLQEAVTNLLDNAVKYSPAESTIVLGGDTDGAGVLLWVRNQGSGIPVEEQEKIFERFYRLQGRNRPAGTGLGLALVREIAHAHGGRVWVDSDPGATTFFLSLPLAPCAADSG
jgi:signal transduction histidine kinase